MRISRITPTTDPKSSRKKSFERSITAQGARKQWSCGIFFTQDSPGVASWRGMTSFLYLIPHHEIYTVPSAMIPGLLDYLDYPDIATLGMPCPLLVVHGQQDSL